MSDNQIMTVNITILSSLARRVFPDDWCTILRAIRGGAAGFDTAAQGEERNHPGEVGELRTLRGLIFGE